MPLSIPNLDDRRFADLRDEALARIPIHTPEWTNFNRSDPGVTLIEVFAFLTESLLYRCNQIPERNRRAFLRLIGVPLQPAASARGIVAFANDLTPPTVVTLTRDVELFAGSVPFRSERGLDVLPVEARAYYKRAIAQQDSDLLSYYQELYASYNLPSPDLTRVQLYETAPLDPRDEGGVNLTSASVDGALWIALLARTPALVEATRRAIAGKILSLGLVPALDANSATLPAGGGAPRPDPAPLLYELPRVPADGQLPRVRDLRLPRYQPLDARVEHSPLAEPGVVELSLPGDPAQLRTWADLDPLEAGVGDFPPALEDTALEGRLVTWLRVRPAVAVQASGALSLRLLWAGINAAMVTQRAAVLGELLTAGTGEPDQAVTLARSPVVPGSVRLSVAGDPAPWQAVDDFAGAGPEVPIHDERLPPGAAPQPDPLPSAVFVADYEAGVLRFGDGMRGRRPPRGATLRVSYDYGEGRAGNVGRAAMSGGPALPSGLTVRNPVRTWGGADAESVAQGERQVAAFLQHRDRLVSSADFATITWRTPGVALGRVEVLPAFHPDLSPNEPGDAPGAVTLLIVPAADPLHADAPQPDQLMLDTICAFLNPRRLVTTELVLRGPRYKGIWISVGIDVVAGTSQAEVREAVRRELMAALAPRPAEPGPAAPSQGWPLRKAVVARELMAVANRVPNVLLVSDLLLAEGAGAATPVVPMRGLELPQVLGVAVSVGDPLPLDQLRGQDDASAVASAARFLPVPIIPEECR